MSLDANPLQQETLIRSGQLKALLGDVSDMWLHRRMRATDLPFPKPITLGGSTRFWRVREVEEWRAAKVAAEADARLRADLGELY